MDKPILILNCVTWSPLYDKTHRLWDVGDWFRHAWGATGDTLAVRHIEEDLIPPLPEFSGLVLTGSPASAYDKLPWITRLEDIVRDAAEMGLPLLGVCFGHQVVAQALGGRVEKNERGWEIGDPEMTLTAEGAVDPIFEDTPMTFRAIQSHKDIVTALPDGAVHLAKSPLCEFQAFGVGDAIRCVQFHPEMGPEHLKYILTPRRELILRDSGIDIDDVLPSVKPTPESRTVFRNFHDQFVDSPCKERGR